MRLTTSMKLLLVAAAGIVALGLGAIEPADPPATDPAVTLVIEDVDQASFDCPYA